jgi:hypothetical protein
MSKYSWKVKGHMVQRGDKVTSKHGKSAIFVSAESDGITLEDGTHEWFVSKDSILQGNWIAADKAIEWEDD